MIFNIGDKKEIFKGKYIKDDFQNKKLHILILFTFLQGIMHFPTQKLNAISSPKNCWFLSLSLKN